jgi:glycosyltransferase involved in cell wall biosynthesis
MKIFFTLTPPLNPFSGGVQHTTFKLGSFFHANGLEVSYYSLSHEGNTTNYPGKAFHAPQSGGENNQANLDFLSSLLDEIRPDIVINQMPYVVPLHRLLVSKKGTHHYVLIACLRNSLFSFISNIPDVLKNRYGPFLSRFLNIPPVVAFLKGRHKVTHARQLRSIMDENDFFILLNEANREELSYFIGDYKKEKLRVIPNSIPEVHKSVSGKENVVLYVGSLNIKQKRADLLLDCWKSAVEAMPGWRFVVVGDGDHYETMKHRVQSEKIPRVEFKGRGNPADEYRKAKIFLMTSAFEGFPNVILEAQSWGVVPVAFNSYGAIGAIVHNGKDSVLVKPFDTKECGRALAALANEPDRLKAMSGMALANAENYVIDNVGPVWIDFFNEILNKGKVQDVQNVFQAAD